MNKCEEISCPTKQVWTGGWTDDDKMDDLHTWCLSPAEAWHN